MGILILTLASRTTPGGWSPRPRSVDRGKAGSGPRTRDISLRTADRRQTTKSRSCEVAVPSSAWACQFLLPANARDAELFESEFIFDPAVESHGHVHASCVIEEPGGALRAVWYENGPSLPPPYFSEQNDKRDDVRIGGARRARDAKAWDKPFVMADTFGVSDNNPCLAVDRRDRVWLI
jgi:hypothetical protein